MSTQPYLCYFPHDNIPNKMPMKAIETLIIA